MGNGGCNPPEKKIYGGDDYITTPQYVWLTGQPSGPQHNHIAPAYTVSPSDLSLLIALVPVLHPFPK